MKVFVDTNNTVRHYCVVQTVLSQGTKKTLNFQPCLFIQQMNM